MADNEKPRWATRAALHRALASIALEC